MTPSDSTVVWRWAVKVYDTYEWNPLQVAVAFGALEVADYLFRNVPNFHYLNSLSKPLTIEQ